MSLFKLTWGLRLFCWRYIPLIAFCQPKVIRLEGNELEIKIPLGWRTKNHLGSMYFGGLAIGADLAGAFLVFHKAKQMNINANFAFKDVQGQFIKRPEADVHFISPDGDKVDEMIARSLQTGERINEPVKVIATCPSLHGDEVMAEFSLTLSVKARHKTQK